MTSLTRAEIARLSAHHQEQINAQAPAKQRKLPARSEHEEQVGLINLCRGYVHKCPELGLIFAIPNGVFIPGSDALARKIAGEMVAEGMTKGVPDLMLAVPRQGFHGLFCELKTITGTVSTEQKEWHLRLRAEGYRVEVCRGRDAAWMVIQDYLGVQLYDPKSQLLKGVGQ